VTTDTTDPRRRDGRPAEEERARLRARFGAVLADARRQAGLSQAALAVAIGSPRSTVARLEQGTRRPSTAMIESLAAVLTQAGGVWGSEPALRRRLSLAAGASLVQATPAGAARRGRRHEAFGRHSPAENERPLQILTLLSRTDPSGRVLPVEILFTEVPRDQAPAARRRR